LASAKKARRFGAHPVKSGQFKGSLQVASTSYTKFFSELQYLNDYLNRRLLPKEPEDVNMQGIITNLQNLLEHASEELIRHYVWKQGTRREQRFLHQIDDGYVTFKSKYDWLLARNLIDQGCWYVMDEIRCLKNDYVHARPNSARTRSQYQGFPLLTKRSVRKLFVDVELTLRKVRQASSRSSKWQTVPPGFASEMGWPAEHIEALEGKNARQ